MAVQPPTDGTSPGNARVTARVSTGRGGPVYTRIARIAIAHPFYSGPRGEVGCLRFEPTLETAALMRRFGMLITPELDGISVVYDARQWAASRPLENRLERGESKRWTRLSFHLFPTDEYFSNVTDMPVTLNRIYEAYYASNALPGGIVNPAGDGDTVEMTDPLILPVRPERFRHAVPEGWAAVVHDVSGEAVFVSAPSFRATEPGPPVWLTEIDISGFKEGRYLVRALPDPARQSDADPDTRRTALLALDRAQGPKMDTPVLLSRLPLPPLCHFDLLLVSPDGRSGAFPVRIGADRALSVVATRHDIVFRPRRTTWVYHILPRMAENRLADLSIRVLSSHDIRFRGPFDGRLEDGTPTTMFRSSAPLALARNSDVRLQLSGRRIQTMATSGTLVDRLPVASFQQVLPRLKPQATPEDADGRSSSAQTSKNYNVESDMFVYV